MASLVPLVLFSYGCAVYGLHLVPVDMFLHLNLDGVILGGVKMFAIADVLNIIVVVVVVDTSCRSIFVGAVKDRVLQSALRRNLDNDCLDLMFLERCRLITCDITALTKLLGICFLFAEQMSMSCTSTSACCALAGSICCSAFKCFWLYVRE